MSIKKSVITSVILSCLGLFSLWLSAKWLGNYDMKTFDGPKTYLIPLAFTAVMFFVLRRWSTLSLTGNGKNPLRFGFYIPIAALISFVISYFTSTLNHTPAVREVLFFLATCLLTGLFEELLCRGLIQNLLSEAFTAHGKSELAAICVSSAIFALMHFANLIEKPYLVLGTVSQVVYAFALGIMLGVVYAKTRSLLAVVVLHGLFNFIGSGVDLFMKSEVSAPAADISILSVIIQWAIVLPGIFFSLRAYKKDSAASSL